MIIPSAKWKLGGTNRCSAGKSNSEHLQEREMKSQGDLKNGQKNQRPVYRANRRWQKKGTCFGSK
jgi:hypothetical protein